jgi:hypothetical protein
MDDFRPMRHNCRDVGIGHPGMKVSASGGAAVNAAAVDPAAVRDAIRAQGYMIVHDVVPAERLRAMRDFWLAAFADPRPVTPIVWGPYLGEPNGIIFDRRESHCLYRSFDYLWNPPMHAPTRETALALSRLRNAVVGIEDRAGELIAEDRYGVYVTTSYYPPGEGWMWMHEDEADDREHWHYILPLTFRGTDYAGGGLKLKDRAGDIVDVDGLVRPGSAIFYDGRLAHGVDRIEPNANGPALGRLQMFAIPVVFERPEAADRLVRAIPLGRFVRAKLSQAKQRLRRTIGA